MIILFLHFFSLFFTRPSLNKKNQYITVELASSVLLCALYKIYIYFFFILAYISNIFDVLGAVLLFDFISFCFLAVIGNITFPHAGKIFEKYIYSLKGKTHSPLHSTAVHILLSLSLSDTCLW